MASPSKLRGDSDVDPCEQVLLIGHDCPGEIVCFEIECRDCGDLLREHASVETICQLIVAAVAAHPRHSRRRSRTGRRWSQPAVAS